MICFLPGCSGAGAGCSGAGASCSGAGTSCSGAKMVFKRKYFNYLALLELEQVAQSVVALELKFDKILFISTYLVALAEELAVQELGLVALEPERVVLAGAVLKLKMI